MSASQAAEQTNGQAQQRAPRKPLTAAQKKAMKAKAAATRAAKLAATGAAPPAPVTTIKPTAARGRAMTQRANALKTAQVANEIAAGFAAKLRTAGPTWSAEYQKTFLAGLTNALPVICSQTA